MRDIFIGLHTVGGVVAFAAGLQAIMPTRDEGQKRRWSVAFWIALVVMIAFVAAAVVADWTGLTTPARATFGALFLLDLFMGVRAWLAARLLVGVDPKGRSRPYVQHVGFVLISLFVGFVVVAALDLGAPAWLVVLAALASVLAGRSVLAAFEERAGAQASS